MVRLLEWLPLITLLVALQRMLLIFFLCGESQRENAEYRSTLVNVRMLLSCIPVQIISNNYFNRCKEVKCQYDQTDNDLLKIYTKIKSAI